jgi:hypothetical protein
VRERSRGHLTGCGHLPELRRVGWCWPGSTLAPSRGRGERRGDRALQVLTQCILADVGNEAWSRAPADLVDLHERLDGEWRFSRQALER